MKHAIALAVGLALSGSLLAAGVNGMKQQERQQLTRKQAVYELVLKWGPHASRAQGRSVHAWADSMVPLFGTADVANLNRALRAKTYDGMVMAMTGDKSQDLSKLPLGATPANLGSMTSDLVYTPLPSCVIVNTTKPGSGGAMAAGTVRHLKASGASFTTQGGEDSNCGIPSGVRALLVSVTSVPPSTSGYFRLWPFGTSEPLAANMSYTSGQLIQNEIVLATSVGGASDFSVRSTGNSHLIVNVLGYFAAPVATAVDCYTETSADVVVAAGEVSSAKAICDAGYGVTGAGCITSNDDVELVETTTNNFLFIPQPFPQPPIFIPAGANCRARNVGLGNMTLNATASCCRVPGR